MNLDKINTFTRIIALIVFIFSFSYVLLDIGKDINKLNVNIQNAHNNHDKLLNSLNNSNYEYLEVTGISMNPTFFQNDILICDKSKTARIGDIVKINDIVHRFVAEYPKYILTKGDNNNYFDNRTTKDKIDCVVIGALY